MHLLVHNWVCSSSSALEALLKSVINKYENRFEFRFLHLLNAEEFDCVYAVAIRENWYY